MVFHAATKDRIAGYVLSVCDEHITEVLEFAKPPKGPPSRRTAWWCSPGMSADITFFIDVVMLMPRRIESVEDNLSRFSLYHRVPCLPLNNDRSESPLGFVYAIYAWDV